MYRISQYDSKARATTAKITLKFNSPRPLPSTLEVNML